MVVRAQSDQVEPGLGVLAKVAKSRLRTPEAEDREEVRRQQQIPGVRLGWVGAYSPEARKRRIARFHAKRKRRVWKKSVQYDVRKNFADTRLRVKGRFVKKEDEVLLKELVGLA